MYKDDGGTLRQCFIDPEGARSYPSDCDFTAVHASGVNTATVARSSIGGMDAGGWSPLYKEFIGNVSMSGGGAFGPQYAFDHVQSVGYAASPAFTEYIEVGVETPVYVVFIEVGSPRGMGHVVCVKVKNPAGEWVQLYAGAADTELAARFSSARKYWQWSPDACRSHFLVSELRIEVDTSSETGVSDWNYIDYVQVCVTGWCSDSDGRASCGRPCVTVMGWWRLRLELHQLRAGVRNGAYHAAPPTMPRSSGRPPSSQRRCPTARRQSSTCPISTRAAPIHSPISRRIARAISSASRVKRLSRFISRR